MAQTLDKGLGIGLTPTKKFELWVKLNPDEIDRAAAILNLKDITHEIAAMTLWLDSHGNLAKIQKRRNWYRFVCNWLRNVAKDERRVPGGRKYRKPIGRFEGDSGPRSM